MIESATSPEHGHLKWYEVWRDALLHPTVASYERLLADPGATNNRAQLWIGLSAGLSFLIVGFGTLIISVRNGNDFWILGSWVFCTGFTMPFISILAAMGLVTITQWIAKLLGGLGTYGTTFYLYAAFMSPLTIISWILIFVNYNLTSFVDVSQMVLVLIFVLGGGLSLLLSLFTSYLWVLAIKTTNRIGWGKAVLALLIPGFVVGACLAAFFAFLGRGGAPSPLS